MRKLFFAICFTLCLAPKIGSSAVRSMANLAEAQNASSETQLQMSQELMAEKQYFRNAAGRINTNTAERNGVIKAHEGERRTARQNHTKELCTHQ